MPLIKHFVQTCVLTYYPLDVYYYNTNLLVLKQNTFTKTHMQWDLP
jgi:hypothetical protein